MKSPQQRDLWGVLGLFLELRGFQDCMSMWVYWHHHLMNLERHCHSYTLRWSLRHRWTWIHRVVPFLDHRHSRKYFFKDFIRGNENFSFYIIYQSNDGSLPIMRECGWRVMHDGWSVIWNPKISRFSMLSFVKIRWSFFEYIHTKS